MKIASVIFSILGVAGIIFSGYIDGGIKLITMTGSLGALMFGIEFILSYVNFNSLSKLEDKMAYNNAGREYRSKAV